MVKTSHPDIKKLIKILLRFLLVLLLLVVLAGILMLLPPVQTFVAKKVTHSLNEKHDIDINIGRIGLAWNGRARVREVYIADHHADTLIYVRRVRADLMDLMKVAGGQLKFGDVKADNARLYIKTYRGEDNANINVFIEKLEPDEPREEPFALKAGSIGLTGSRLRVIDENKDKTDLLDLTELSLSADDFSVAGPVISATVRAVAHRFNDQFDVRDLSGEFSIDEERLQLTDMDLQTEHSFIRGDLTLNKWEENFSDFPNRVVMNADIGEAMITAEDVNVFFDEFGPGQRIRFTTRFSGTLNDFVLEGLRLSNQRTAVTGDIAFRQLLSGNGDFVISSNNHYVLASHNDLSRLMPGILGENLPEIVRNLGDFSVSGEAVISGPELDFRTEIISMAGRAITNLNIKDVANPDRATYKGDLDLTDFDLGLLSGSGQLGTISAVLDVDGRGFSAESLNAKVNGHIASVHFNGYDYTNIDISGNLKAPLFDGKLTIDDPNLKFNFEGLADLSQELNQFDFEAEVAYADLYNTNIVNRDSISIFTGHVTMDMQGSSLDDAVGTLKFYESTYQNLMDDYFFDDLTFVSRMEDDVRSIEIISPDIATGHITGHYVLTDLPNLFQNSFGSMYANYKPDRVTTNQFAMFDFEIFNKIVEVFVPELRFGEGTSISGSVASDESEFKLWFRTPEITAFDYHFVNVDLQMDNNNPFFNTNARIEHIKTGLYDVEAFNMLNITRNDTLYMKTDFYGGENRADRIYLDTYHTIDPDGKSVLGFTRSDLHFRGNKWYINRENDSLHKVTFDNNFKDVLIERIVLDHGDESIEVAGSITNGDNKDIQLTLNNIELNKLSSEADSLQLSGRADGNLSLLQRDGIYFPEANVVLDSLEINDIPLGLLDLQVAGNEDLTSYDVDMSLIREELRLLTATGGIEVAGNNAIIDLNTELHDLDLRAVDPLVSGNVLANLRGLVSGGARVSGNYTNPALNGNLYLSGAGLTIPYLNIDFELEEGSTVALDNNRYTILETTATDTKYGTKARINGLFQHRRYKDWSMDFNLNTDRFLVLDTEMEKGAMYYGTAFIKGNGNISGALDELAIEVEATTGRGTAFKIPLDDMHATGDASYIHFVSPEEKAGLAEGGEVTRDRIKGLTLSFDLDITPDAEVEIIVDQQDNSTLKGRGEGTLFLEISTLGRFNMWGDFLVHEATYDFRYAGLFHRQFQVERGGNISWEGQPERARLDLQAIHRLKANPSPLLESSDFNRSIPTEVVLGLQGELVEPRIDYEIRFPGLSSSVRNEIDLRLQDPQQRENQALYLMASGMFQGGYRGFGLESVSNIVSDLFADQDSRFQVGLMYTQADAQAVDSDRVGVTVTTQIHDRIMINGQLGVPVGGVQESALAGDFDIQLLLNEDGTLKLQVFNRETDLQFMGESLSFAQGGGISYSVDFDTFKELTNKIFKGKVEIDSAEGE